LECWNYRDQRKKLRREVGRGKMQMEALLGDPKTIKTHIGIHQGNRKTGYEMMAETMGSTIDESRTGHMGEENKHRK
jgi:hypothetical protein